MTPPAAFLFMYILYSDESGEISNPADQALIVAGIAVHEEAVRPLAGEVNNLLGRFVGRQAAKSLEIHGSPLRGGREDWRSVSRGRRFSLAESLMSTVEGWTHASSSSTVLPFVVVVDRNHSQAPMELGYGELLHTFDGALRKMRRGGDGHNGVLVADRGKYERAIAAWVEVARAVQPRPAQDPRRLHALVETPFFVDSKSTRLMQLADMLSYSFFRAYNAGDWDWANRVLPSFARSEGALLHFTSGACSCPACV